MIPHPYNAGLIVDMPEKKRPEKNRTLLELERSLAEISVANGRAVEPFIKVFSSSGENVTKSALGSLAGVFVVDDTSEDSAYIVNFLASVAKKEYFNNPRRGAIESFEAALHKINLALAELVKHGNVAWLGHLHGALCVLEKNTLHFSVTGEARILLLRNALFSEISEGLASPDSHTHPIKTFVEVSSGRLLPQDKVLIASPEVFSLFSAEELRKNALRMDPESFSQFLRTGLINELDRAGTIIMDFRERVIDERAPIRKPAEPEKKIFNVFSKQAFDHPKKQPEPENEPRQEETQRTPEYVDSKTGHIYIQGDAPHEKASHPLVERMRLFWHDLSPRIRSFTANQGRLWRKTRKQVASHIRSTRDETIVAIRKAAHAMRRHWRKRAEAQKARKESKATTEMPEKLNEPQAETPPEIQPEQNAIAPHPPLSDENSEIPSFIKEKLAAFYQREVPTQENMDSKKTASLTDFIRAGTQKTRDTMFTLTGKERGRDVLKLVASTLIDFFTLIRHGFTTLSRNISPRTKRYLAGASLVLTMTLAALFFFTKQDDSSISHTPKPREESRSESPFPLTGEKNARIANQPTTIASAEGAVASVFLANELYLITAHSIKNVRTNEEFPVPSDHPAIFASPMDDLRLIFVLTDQKELFAWSPISRNYTKNEISLPENATIAGIGTYLTYLYIMDSTSDQIYRFPRAEGGFGSPTSWLRETIMLEETSRMAVNETIFLSSDSMSLQAFFRGRPEKRLESPATPLSVTQIFSHPGTENVYVLDATNRRFLIWSLDGVLIGQYFSETLADARALTVDEKNNEAFFVTANSLFSLRFER